jgi:stage III sporulation protein SpoIIIAA
MNDVDRLLAILPDAWRSEVESPDELTEFVLDLGRPFEVRYGREKLFYEEPEFEVTRTILAEALSKLGSFGPDNRAGMDRTLHRISRIVNRTGETVGLTCRVGKAFLGCVKIIEDLVSSGESILLLGAPGSGKTTKLRDVCRLASTTLDRAVVIVDTSNEIAGDGEMVHPAVGRSRRLQVPLGRTQHEVMQEAVENHTPEVLVIDEIGNRDEAEACRTFAQRGVQLVATAHGKLLEDLVNNPALRDLVGGVKSATLGDEEARRRGTQKTVQERVSTPTFTVVVEIIDYNTVAVHSNVAEAVDCLLAGGEVYPQTRVMKDDDWETLAPARNRAPKPRSHLNEERPQRGQRRKGRGRWRN